MAEQDLDGMPLHEAARAAGVQFHDDAVPRSNFVEANRLRFHYLEWGKPTDRPLVMLHGMGQTAHSWDFAALALCDRYRIVALDQRGHGDSDWAPNAEYSLSAHQGDLAAVLSALDLDDIVLMGLSMGGRNAFTYAANHPAQVAALIVVDSAPELQRSGADTIRRFVKDMDVLDTFEEFVDKTRKYNPRRSDRQIRGSLTNNLKQLPDGRWTWKYDRVFRSPDAKPWTDPDIVERMWQKVEGVQCPALVVRGAGSKVLSQKTAEEMAERLQNGRLAVVPDAGHLVPGDNPTGFHQVVNQFLADTPPII
jgi:esterase